MNITLPPDLEAKLNRLASETGRDARDLALALLASTVDHDEWFRQQIEEARKSARSGRLIEHDEVAARLKRRSGV